MKLGIEHLAPYLPYKLKIVSGLGQTELSVDLLDWAITNTNQQHDRNFGKPILRPLSDLTKEIEHKGQKGGDLFMPTRILMCPTFKFCADKEELLFNLQSSESIERCPYNVVQKLLEWHFDVLNLIENELAIEK